MRADSLEPWEEAAKGAAPTKWLRPDSWVARMIGFCGGASGIVVEFKTVQFKLIKCWFGELVTGYPGLCIYIVVLVLVLQPSAKPTSRAAVGHCLGPLVLATSFTRPLSEFFK